MDDSQKNFRLGLFVVITLFLLFGILFLLGGQSLFKPKVVFETYFDNSVSGLAVGSAVLYRGVPLGQVISIELSDSEYEAEIANQNRKSYVIVRSEITGTKEAVRDWENNIQSSLAKGMRAQTQLAGITGQQYLSLDYITVEPEDDLKFDWQPKHSYIPSAPSSTGKIIASIQSLLANLNESDINKIGQNLNTLIITVEQKVSQLDTHAISDGAVQFLDQTNTLMAQSKISDTLANLNTASANLDQVLADPSIKQSLASLARITGTLDKSLAAGGDINGIIAELDIVLQRADAIMADNQYDINSTIRDLRTMAENLKAFSEAAKNNPSGMLFSTPPEKIKLEEKK